MAEISDRKREHLELALDPSSQSGRTAGWEDVHLVASSLPSADLEGVDLTIEISGLKLKAPFVIASMTGGHENAVEVNERLAHAAQIMGLAIGSGSQRAALRHPELVRTYSVIREAAPDAVVMANVGACQLIDQGEESALTRDEIEAVVGMLDAQLLIVHLNVIEELIQPEGDSALTGLVDAIARLVSDSSVPVVAKETGSGMSAEVAAQLVSAGVQVLDVGGAGGTSFARIEGERAARRGDRRGSRLGETFAAWGISTAASILETRESGVPVIATGGVRSGLDAAKAISLGASAVGLGRPLLEAALRDEGSVVDEMSMIIDELKMAVVLTGGRDLADLQAHRPVIAGDTLAWAQQRGLL